MEPTGTTGDLNFASAVCGAEKHGLCQKIGLSDAGSALAGALGPTASIVWALGLLASAQSSTMTITYAGQFVLDGFFEVSFLAFRKKHWQCADTNTALATDYSDVNEA